MKDLIDRRLSELADLSYKQFNLKIIPTKYEVLGVRMPALKNLAKELSTKPDVRQYLDTAEFPTYEHVILYGFILGKVKGLSLDEVFKYLDPLILRFDNWAHVDTLESSLKIFRKHPKEVLEHFLPMKHHEGEFTKRFFVILLMAYYMDAEHIDDTLKHLTEVPQGQYYVDMAIAWAISLALIKHYDKTLPILRQNLFTKFVHNKAIQKARESYRVSPERKEFLKGLKQ